MKWSKPSRIKRAQESWSHISESMQQFSGNTGTKRHCRAIHLEGTAQGKSAKPPNTDTIGGEGDVRLSLSRHSIIQPQEASRYWWINPQSTVAAQYSAWFCLQYSQSRPALNMPAWDGVGICFAEGVGGEEGSIHRGSLYTHIQTNTHTCMTRSSSSLFFLSSSSCFLFCSISAFLMGETSRVDC